MNGKNMKNNVKWIRREDDCFILPDLRSRCLNSMSQIDEIADRKWHFFRKILNEYDFESRDIAVNRAFYKLWEMLHIHQDCINFTDEATLKTLHLAEAPGSFVQVIKKLYPKAYCFAISKSPSSYSDVVKHGKQIPVFSPNVLSLPRLDYKYVDMVNSDDLEKMILGFNGTKFNFITADGGFDEEGCYEAKEMLHYNLILSEIISILCLQETHGSCVLKIFDIFSKTSFSILWFLCKYYQTFTVIKPKTSRPTNAEKYVVCKNFKGIKSDNVDVRNLVHKLSELTNVHINSSMRLETNGESVPEWFTNHLKSKCHDFASKQIEAINEVMKVVKYNNPKGKSIYIDKRRFLEKKRLAFQTWKKEHDYVE